MSLLSERRYNNMYQWEDGTIGYFSQYRSMREPPSCARMERAGLLELYRCNSREEHVFLCEDGGSPKHNHRNHNGVSIKRNISLADLSGFSISRTYVFCPSGHWTHRFLACDKQTACWQHDSFRKDSGSREQKNMTSPCQSPLSTLFTCKNGVEHVPYSLVCDHSQDCRDSSDEDFCVHPPCSGSGLFECTNK